jgi:hypothetical protein
MTPETIQNELTDSEIAELDMRAIGNVILDWTIDLRKAVYAQILEPISEWLDDPDFLKKYAVINDTGANWAEYKQKQRKRKK